MNKRSIVDLMDEERARLRALLTRVVAPARRLTRARLLLLADEGAPTRPSPPPCTCTGPPSSARGDAYTPRHGSWLTMAEREFSALGRQCLDRRLPDQGPLRHEIAIWQRVRNAERGTVERRCTVADARTKLRRLYLA